ncbi:MAG: DNA helicase HerA-like ATPase [Vicingaceae bacterium]|jgi:DNA helicase HerA-like ATPase
MQEKFVSEMAAAYQFEGDYITLGAGMLNGEAQHNSEVRIPLKTLNRHGLIAGATGTGKTVSLQVLAEQFSSKGIPVVLMDLKGDLSGLAAEGTTNKHIVKRHSYLSEAWTSGRFALELLSLSDEPGVRLKATVTEFGPILMAKVLGLNDTQRGILAVVFKYCDDNDLALINLEDLKKVLQFATGVGKEAFSEEYGSISKTSVSTILRKILELETQGAEKFFQELSFDVDDLVRYDRHGKGVISVVRLADIKDKPKLFSTFMLSLLAEIYSTFPEQGDAAKPKLCLFIDEAHLIFDEASKELLDQIESIVKLIRSKGVGIYFCTQRPTDVPNEVLSQLGLKVQHALRAFTAKDRKDIKRISENFPESEFYKTDEVLTSLGIGEALVTALNEKGVPTPLVATLMRPPMSRMGILNDTELKDLLQESQLMAKYNKVIDRESAEEILGAKMKQAKEDETQVLRLEEAEKIEKSKTTSSRRTTRTSTRKEESTLTQLSKNTMVRQIGRTIGRELIRGLMGVLGIKKR